MFVATTKFCCNKRCVLSQQKHVCCNKSKLVVTNVFTTKLCLSQQKYVCCNKNVFVVTKDIFVATILQLWPLQPMVDTTLSAVREPMATCVVHPASCCMLLVMTVTIYFIYPRGKFIPANPCLNHHCPGSLSVQTWCSYSWTTIAQVLCAHMMFHFRLNVPGSFWAQTWCSLSRDRMEFVPSEHKHHVPLPEIECTCVRNEGSCAKKPGCSLYGTCFSVCSWWFQGLKHCKPPFTPKQSFSVFKQSFSTLTENLPLHPCNLYWKPPLIHTQTIFFLSFLKTSLYTQSFSVF